MDEELFVDQEAIRNFICEICLQVVKDISVIQHSTCEQLFCQDCFAAHASQSSMCPHCNESFAESTQKKMSRFALDSYLKLVRRCSNEGCVVTYLLSGMTKHEQDCEYRHVQCQFCNDSVILKSINEHYSSDCAMYPVPCRVPGCTHIFPRSLMRDHRRDNWEEHEELFFKHIDSIKSVKISRPVVQRDSCYRMDNETIRLAVKWWCADSESAFRQYGHISTWDTSRVTSMCGLFFSEYRFNDDINNWNVSNVCAMSEMFKYADKFNQPLNNWNTRNVTDMREMFNGARAFNQSLNDWNVSKVTDMNEMFREATKFNQPLNDWDVRKVTTMVAMFCDTNSFNQPLDKWNINNVTSMDHMFENATAFNCSLVSWRISSDRVSTYGMFSNIPEFNHALIEGWKIDDSVFACAEEYDYEYEFGFINCHDVTAKD